MTVAEICDWYTAEAEAGRILGRRRRAIKASTLAMDRSRIESHIKPLLGRRQIGSLKLGNIEGAKPTSRPARRRKRASAAVVAPPRAAKASRLGLFRHCIRF